jgi:hypothetical protein
LAAWELFDVTHHFLDVNSHNPGVILRLRLEIQGYESLAVVVLAITRMIRIEC